jgi:molybdopterin-guanine dinucleotide biosynthesis protein A
MGPLGGIAAALHLADDEGSDAVLTCGVDSAHLPENLPDLLGTPPAYVADQPVIALWPVSAAGAVDAILAGTGKHSLRALAEQVGARAVQLARNPDNVNTPADLAEAEKRHGL